MTPVQREWVQKWIAALRDPAQVQCHGGYTDESGACCAIGLLHKVIGRRPGEIGVDVTAKETGISYSFLQWVIQLNDWRRRSFPAIADTVAHTYGATP